MKYIDILNVRANVINEILKKKIPMRIKFPLMNNIDKMEACRAKWANIYEELVKRYCQMDENGNPVVINDSYSVAEDKMADFQQEFNAIANMEACDVDTVSVEWLEEDYDEYRFDILTIEELHALKFMIA